MNKYYHQLDTNQSSSERVWHRTTFLLVFIFYHSFWISLFDGLRKVLFKCGKKYSAISNIHSSLILSTTLFDSNPTSPLLRRRSHRSHAILPAWGWRALRDSGSNGCESRLSPMLFRGIVCANDSPKTPVWKSTVKETRMMFATFWICMENRHLAENQGTLAVVRAKHRLKREV